MTQIEGHLSPLERSLTNTPQSVGTHCSGLDASGTVKATMALMMVVPLPTEHPIASSSFTESVYRYFCAHVIHGCRGRGVKIICDLSFLRDIIECLIADAYCTHEGLVYAMCIVDRATTTTRAMTPMALFPNNSSSELPPLIISVSNARRVLLAAVMLAGKIHEDKFFNLETMCSISGLRPTVNTKYMLAECEWQLCRHSNFCLHIQPEEFTATWQRIDRM